MNKYLFKRVEKKNWSGIAKYDGASDQIAPLMEAKSGRIKTGLSSEESVKLEKALRLQEGDLSPHGEFWTDFFVLLSANEVKTFTPDEDPEEKLQYLFLKNHKFVANGFEDLKKKPYAMYVLYSEENKAKANNLNRSVKKDAYVAFASMTLAEKLDALTMLGEKVSNLSPEVVDDKLGYMLEANPSRFVDIINDDFYKHKLFILKAVNLGIITKGRGNFENAVYNYGEEFMGEGLDNAVKFLSRPNNQGLKIAIDKDLKGKQTRGTLLETADLEEIETQFAVPTKVVEAKPKAKRAAPKGKQSKVLNTTDGKRIKSSVEEVAEDGKSTPDFDQNTLI